MKNATLNLEANTKRQILSSLSKAFGPLGVFGPMLMPGKLVIRSLSQLNVGWDQEVSEDIVEMWKKCCSEFMAVSNLPFKRRSFSEDQPISLFLFADASEEAYGCALYAVQGDYCSLIFAKLKVSSIRKRSLPTLELLASLLALKCLSSIFEDRLFVNIRINSIVLFVDR